MNLGEKLKKRREKLSLTQEQLEESTGISQPRISLLENGGIKWPRSDTIVILADALQVTTDYLLRDEAPEPA